MARALLLAFLLGAFAGVVLYDLFLSEVTLWRARRTLKRLADADERDWMDL